MSRLAAATAVAVVGVGAGVADAAVKTDLFAPLHASHRFPAAHGHSDYERAGSRREVDVELRGIPGLAGRRVVVFVNRHRVGTMRVSSRGRAERDWETRHGQAVPRAGAGSPVRVRTTSGALVMSGRYIREVEHD